MSLRQTIISASASTRYNQVQVCHLTKEWVRFFARFVNSKDTNSAGLTSCEIIARSLLQGAVSKSDLRYYTFQERVGHGLRGLVFSGSYKGDPIVVKIQRLHVPGLSDDKIVIGKESFYFEPVSEFIIRREVDTPLTITQRLSQLDNAPFRVPKVFSPLSKRWANDRSMKIATFVMEKLPIEDGHNFFKIKVVKHKLLPRAVDSYSKIPTILTALHQINIVHMDLHLENILFDEIPCIFDFGRSLDISTITDESDVAMLRVMDYIIPLFSVANLDSNVEQTTIDNCATLLRAYVNSMPTNLVLSLTKNVTDPSLQQSVREIIRLCGVQNVEAIVRVRDLISSMTNNPTFSRRRNYFDMVDR